MFAFASTSFSKQAFSASAFALDSIEQVTNAADILFRPLDLPTLFGGLSS